MGVTIKQKGLKPPSTPKKIQKNKLPPRDYHGRFITKGIYLELSPPDRDEKGRFISRREPVIVTQNNIDEVMPEKTNTLVCNGTKLTLGKESVYVDLETDELIRYVPGKSGKFFDMDGFYKELKNRMQNAKGEIMESTTRSNIRFYKIRKIRPIRNIINKIKQFFKRKQS